MLQDRDDWQMTFGERRWTRREVLVDAHAGVAQKRLRLLDLHLPAEPRHADRALRAWLADDQLLLGEFVDQRFGARVTESKMRSDLVDRWAAPLADEIIGDEPKHLVLAALRRREKRRAHHAPKSPAGNIGETAAQRQLGLSDHAPSKRASSKKSDASIL
ncbi:hypothetical protein [uncultured Sphingomonas sp.]|uniref:hypothetical protein n=1 Tax=uncultured Sphingomonas sp. TaxID=158754 RepID=UPI0025E9C603|nr:hypothetical protein [uncultured Sphingomonas sp.]